MSVRVLIVGYYGFGLISDEAVLESIVTDLRSAIEGIQICATSANLARLGIDGIRTVPISSFSTVLAEMYESDLIVIGGGGVYNEDNTYNSYTYMTPRQAFNDLCAAVPVLSTCIGKPCVILAVGVFAVSSPLFLNRVQQAFTAAASATVRDRASLTNLKFHSSVPIRTKVTADPVFRLHPKAPTHRPYRSIEFPVVGVSLRHWNLSLTNTSGGTTAWEEQVAHALDRFIEQFDARCVFFPFQSNPESGVFSDDIPVIERVRSQMLNKHRTEILEYPSSPSEMAWHIRSVDLMICMRFHSLIMAIAQQRPFVAIGYSEKILNTLSDIGLEHAEIDIERLDQELLFLLMKKEYEMRDVNKDRREVVALERSKVAEENVSQILRLLEYPHSGQLNADHVGPLLFHFVRRAAELEELLEIQERAQPTRLALSEKLAADNARDFEAQYRIGKLLIERHVSGEGQPDDAARAVEHLTAALLGGADEYWCLFFRGAARYHLGEYDQALSDLEMADRLRPDRDDTVSVKEAVIAALARMDISEQPDLPPTSDPV